MLSVSIQRHGILLCPCQAWSLGQGWSGSPPQRSSLPLQQMIPVFCFLLLLFPFTSLLFFWITAWTLAFFKIQFNPVIITNYQYYLWCLNFPFVTCESPSLCISCYLFLLFFNIYLFGCAGLQLQPMGSSSLTRNRTQTPCIGISQVLVPGNQGSPHPIDQSIFEHYLAFWHRTS